MSNVDIVLYVLLHGKLFLNKNLFQLLSSMFAPQACFKCATLHTQTKQIPFSYLFFSQCIAFFQTIYLRTKLMTSKMLCTEKKIIWKWLLAMKIKAQCHLRFQVVSTYMCAP